MSEPVQETRTTKAWESDSTNETIRLVLLALIWFLLQSGDYYAVVRTGALFHNVGFHGSPFLPLGGIVGSAAFVVLRGTVSDRRDMRPVLVFILAISLIGLNMTSFLAWLAPVTFFFLLAAALVTVLFLGECAAVAKRDIRFILWSFFFIAIAVPTQIALTLLPLAAAQSLLLNCLLELAFVAAIARTLSGAPLKLPPFNGLQSKMCELASLATSQTPCSDAGGEMGKNRLPWQIVLHIFIYYLVILCIWTVADKPSLHVPNGAVALSSGLATLALFYFAYVRKDGYLHYWLRTRQLTLPMAITALPLLALGDLGTLVSLVLIQTAYRFFLLSSYVEVFFICKNTFISNQNALAGVHAVMYCGMVVGISTGTMIAPTLSFGSPAPLCLACVAANLLLIAASCWLGDDKSAAKVWGRRIELTPKGRQDHLAARAVQLVSERYGLTPKEAETLSYMVQGANIEIIAEKLFVSVNTVRTHIRGIYSKLGVHSRAEVCRVFEAARKEI